MSEGFIAVASSALNTAWAQPNTLTVDCEPLTDALVSLSIKMNTLATDFSNLREQNDALRQQQLATAAENQALKSRLVELTGQISSLMDSSTGMVGRQEYQSELGTLRNEVDNRLKEQQDAMNARLGNTVRTSDEDRERVMQLIDSVDGIRSQQLEGFASSRSSLGQVESQLRGLISERTSTHLQLSHKHEEFVTQSQERMTSVRNELLERMAQNRQAGGDALKHHVEELVQQLDTQAKRVDNLARNIAQRDGAIPSKAEIEKLLSQMSNARQSVDDSQMQLQETFAQCMSLLESSAAKQGGGNSSSSSSSLSSSVTMTPGASSSSSRYQQQQQQQRNANAAAAAAAAAGGGGAGGVDMMNNNMSFSTSSLGATFNSNSNTYNDNNNNSPSRQNNNNLFAGRGGEHVSAFSLFETRLDHIQQLVERIMQEEIPYLASDAKAKHEDHLILVQAQKRAEAMMLAICDVCGLGSADILATALRMPTVHKAQQIIQGGLKKLLTPIMEEIVSPQLLQKVGGNLWKNSSAATPTKGGGGGDENEFGGSASRLLTSATVAASRERYEQAMRMRGESLVNRNTNNPSSSGSAEASSSSSSSRKPPQQQQQVKPAASSSSSSSSSSGGKRETLKLGIDIAEVQAVRSSSSPSLQGVVGIMSLASGSLAEKHGFARGDVILTIDGAHVASCEHFMQLVQNADRVIKAECRAKGEQQLHGSLNFGIIRGSSNAGGGDMNIKVQLEWI